MISTAWLVPFGLLMVGLGVGIGGRLARGARSHTVGSKWDGTRHYVIVRLPLHLYGAVQKLSPFHGATPEQIDRWVALAVEERLALFDRQKVRPLRDR